MIVHCIRWPQGEELHELTGYGAAVLACRSKAKQAHGQGIAPNQIVALSNAGGFAFCLPAAYRSWKPEDGVQLSCSQTIPCQGGGWQADLKKFTLAATHLSSIDFGNKIGP